MFKVVVDNEFGQVAFYLKAKEVRYAILKRKIIQAHRPVSLAIVNGHQLLLVLVDRTRYYFKGCMNLLGARLNCFVVQWQTIILREITQELNLGSHADAALC